MEKIKSTYLVDRALEILQKDNLPTKQHHLQSLNTYKKHTY